MLKARAIIDFETRSSVDLKKVGAFKYAQDSSTRILCLAYRLPGQEPKLWHPDAPWLPNDLLFWIEDGGKVESHNAEFEFCIWNFVGRKFFSWPKLPIDQLICSAAKAAVLGLPRSLGGLTEALNTEIKKDNEGHKIMLRVSKLKRPSKKDPEFFDDDPEKMSKLFSYCIDDILAEEGASNALPDLSERSQRFWELTLKINERGIYCDVELCKKAIEFAKEFERELLKELNYLTSGEVKTARQVQKMIEFLIMEGVETDNLRAKTVSELLKKPDLSFRAKRVLVIRSLLSKSSLSKFSSMIAMAGPDNRIRGTLLFSGASTGRYTGRGIQPQNFIKGEGDADETIKALKFLDYEDFKAIYPNVFLALSNCLRGMLRAAPGNELFAADFNAIESRAVFWLAGHAAGLRALEEGRDLYVEMAKVIYGLDDDAWEALPKKEQKAKRQLGKQAILGCGYGMGASKFEQTCQTYNIEVDPKIAEKAVKAYRATHWPIPALWADVERAAIGAVEKPGKVKEAGKCRFCVKGRFLFVELPSKRRLAFRDPSLKEEKTNWGERQRLGYWAVNSLTKKWCYEQTYGGKLVENITQAVCADLLLEAKERLENNNYPVILSVHDEIVSERKKGLGDLTEFEELMGELPAWAEGFPMKLEGWKDERYKK